MPGIECVGWGTLLITALLLGFFNAFLKPILFLLTLPLQLLTLGLFTLVINALLLMLTAQFVKEFFVEGFWAAFFGGLVISIVSGFLNLFFGGAGAAWKRTFTPGKSTAPPAQGSRRRAGD